MATLSSLRTDLRSRIGNPTTDDVTNATLTSIINRAYHQLCDRFKYWNTRRLSTITTVNGTQSYTLPSGYIHIISVWDDTNHVELKPRDEEWVARWQLNPVAGKPTDYLHRFDSLLLFSTPDGAYSIKIYNKYTVADLAADNDTPVLQVDWHDGIVYLARAVYFDDIQDFPKRDSVMSSYDLWLRTKPSELSDEIAARNDDGVEVPTLQSAKPKADFDHYPWE